MKHNWVITSILLVIFILSQIVGLYIVQSYRDVDELGAVTYKELPLNLERPELSGSDAIIYLVSGILIGTLLMLGLIKLNKVILTKIWFLSALVIGLTLACGAFLPGWYAFAIGLIVGIVRVFFPNAIIHNISEIFLYGGLMVLFDSFLTIYVTVILLIIISIYDAIAVWKIKHMITMAKYQTQHRLFAGACIPYNLFSLKSFFNFNNNHTSSQKKVKASVKSSKSLESNQLQLGTKSAILGGGDMAFSLMFAIAIDKVYGMNFALIIVTCTTAALFGLFYFGKKNTFYPAMPFISAGCFLGYGIILLVQYLI